MKKILLSENYIELIANSDLTATGYKVLLMFISDSLTQAQVAERLGLHRQNVNRIITDLKGKGLIEIDRIEGRNHFFKAVTNVNNISRHIKGQTSMLDN